MEAYVGAARRRVHLATVLLRLPSGHRPGRRQARHFARAVRPYRIIQSGQSGFENHIVRGYSKISDEFFIAGSISYFNNDSSMI